MPPAHPPFPAEDAALLRTDAAPTGNWRRAFTDFFLKTSQEAAKMPPDVDFCRLFVHSIFASFFHASSRRLKRPPRRPKTAQDGHKAAQEGLQERILVDS